MSGEVDALKAGQRLAVIDILRGLIIVIMALDHVRRYTHISGFALDPMDFHVSNPVLFAMRWSAHLCAPAFVFLAGVSAWLQYVRLPEIRRLSIFLLSRGLWLMVVEVTIVGLGWSFGWPVPVLLGILWAIGWSMIALAGLVYLPRKWVLIVGLVITLGHNLLDSIHASQLGVFGIVWNFLYEPRLVSLGGMPVLALSYPVLPWIGVIALGFGMGHIFLAPDRDRRLILLGAGLLVLFLTLRGGNFYGDPRPWAVQAHLEDSVMDFLNVQKYPPSLLYLCVTLGAVLLLAPWLERLPARLGGILRTFGAVPLMAYVAHLYIVHAVTIVAHLAMGKPLTGQFNSLYMALKHPMALQGTDMPLWVVWVCWVIVIALLYPVCRWWLGIKHRHKNWWLAYL